MAEIVIFKSKELEILESLKEYLFIEERQSDIDLIEIKRSALRSLANSISLYPSITKNLRLGSNNRSVETLINRLCISHGRETIFSIPTKAILGQSYLLAKLNFFYMMYYLVKDLHETTDLNVELVEIIKEIVFTMLAEEIFLEILGDKSIEFDIKRKAVFRLTELWEFRLDYGVNKFAPSLEVLWAARESVNPVYGTLLGSSEILKLGKYINSSIFSFIESAGFTGKTGYSFEEFIFGISFEDLSFLRLHMFETHKNLLSFEEIKALLKNRRIYRSQDTWDPRDFYSFFKVRKENAKNRNRNGLDGPEKTLEEHMMIHLLKMVE